MKSALDQERTMEKTESGRWEAADDVRLERVEAARRGLAHVLGVIADGAADHGVVDAEAARHGLDGPQLAQDEAAHLGLHLGRDGHRESPVAA
jgi:hypothetical protein